MEEEIRKQTGLCSYCEKNEVEWFCCECWFGVCDDCLDTETNPMDRCMGDCYTNLPMMLGISLIGETSLDKLNN